MNIAQLQRTKAFMPPFAGTAVDVEAVVQVIRWAQADAPSTWPSGPPPAPSLIAIQAWLDAAGTSMRKPTSRGAR